MKRNFESRLDRLETLVQKLKDDGYCIFFNSGYMLEMTEKRFLRMFDSIQEGQPNEDVQVFLNQLENGYEDDGGLVYLIDAENLRNDPERMAALWRDDE